MKALGKEKTYGFLRLFRETTRLSRELSS